MSCPVLRCTYVIRAWLFFFGLFSCVHPFPPLRSYQRHRGWMESYINSSILLKFSGSSSSSSIPQLKNIQPAPSFYLDTLYFSQEALLQPPITSFKALDPPQDHQDAFHKSLYLCRYRSCRCRFCCSQSSQADKACSPYH